MKWKGKEVLGVPGLLLVPGLSFPVREAAVKVEGEGMAYEIEYSLSVLYISTSLSKK